MSQLFFFIIMFCAGITVAVQPSVNARLAQKVGVLESACLSFAVGTAVLLLAVSAIGRISFRGITETVWWEWTGGILGAVFVSVTIFVVPRIGTAAAMAAVIAAQLLTGIILDHYGFFGFRGVPLTWTRLAGAVLLLVGAALVFRRS